MTLPYWETYAAWEPTETMVPLIARLFNWAARIRGPHSDHGDHGPIFKDSKAKFKFIKTLCYQPYSLSVCYRLLFVSSVSGSLILCLLVYDLCLFNLNLQPKSNNCKLNSSLLNDPHFKEQIKREISIPSYSVGCLKSCPEKKNYSNIILQEKKR